MFNMAMGDSVLVTDVADHRFTLTKFALWPLKYNTVSRGINTTLEIFYFICKFIGQLVHVNYVNQGGLFISVISLQSSGKSEILHPQIKWPT